MELHEAAGMAPSEVFAATTIRSARAMGPEDELGLLGPGKLPDLLPR
jgi:imidazolonepropionase-like amidohydrolase